MKNLNYFKNLEFDDFIDNIVDFNILKTYIAGECVFDGENVFLLIVIGMIIHWLPTNFKRRYRLWFAYMPLHVMVLIVVLAVFVIYQFVTADLQKFIYFQF